MKILGIDYGTKRIGVAIGDTDTKTAVPLCVVHSSQSAVHSIEKIVKEERVGLIVVGLPLTTEGQESKSSGLVREFIKELDALKGIKVELQDERFTTKEVERVMRGYGKAKKGVDKDAAAAALILQSWLDSL